MPQNSHSWPASLRDIAEVIGASASSRLVDAYGGTQQNYIPKHPTPNHPFVSVIGIDNMKKLSAAFGGETIPLPLYAFRNCKKGAIIDRLEDNITPRQIALELKVSERYVWMIKAELGKLDDADNRQGSLF